MKNIRELTRLSNGKELDIKYPVYLYDNDGNKVYCEVYTGYYEKCVYKDNKVVYFEDSTGYSEWTE